MNEQLNALLDGTTLACDEARTLMRASLEEPVNGSAVAALLTALRMRGVTVDELDGFSQALLELAIPLDLGVPDLVDVCGTGGDSKGTFNISTATAFVLAALDYKVAKHGNYAVSSSCGSSNVLEALGVTLSSDPSHLKRSLQETNVCFLHAPLFHPALKRVAPIRKELGFRTVFNMLGPLVNPARPTFQANGVYDRSLLRLYGYLLRQRGHSFAAFCSVDGHDEVTLTAPLLVTTRDRTVEIPPAAFGGAPVLPHEIRGGSTIEESAAILSAVLHGKGPTAHQEVVAASAGLVMWTKEGSGTLHEHVARARDALRAGTPVNVLSKTREVA